MYHTIQPSRLRSVQINHSDSDSDSAHHFTSHLASTRLYRRRVDCDPAAAGRVGSLQPDLGGVQTGLWEQERGVLAGEREHPPPDQSEELSPGD